MSEKKKPTDTDRDEAERIGPHKSPGLIEDAEPVSNTRDDKDNDDGRA